MNKSHTAARTSEQPTFAQLKELMGQIDNGRITKDALQEFLRGCTSNLSPENKEMLDLLAQNVELWQKHFPGHETELTARMIRLLDWKKPMELRKSDPGKWKVFKRAIFWINFNAVRFVDRQYLACDLPLVPIEDSFAQSITNEFETDYGDRLETEKSLVFNNVVDVMFSLPVAALRESKWYFAWKIDGVLNGTSFRWLRKRHGQPDDILYDLLEENLSLTLRTVGTLLTLNERIEDAYTLLEMWGSGNYPIGFDKDNQLVVLCA